MCIKLYFDAKNVFLEVGMSHKNSGIHIPHYKNTADTPPVTMDAPTKVILPLSMHIGKPAAAVVKPGDTVYVGTLVAEAQGPVSSPIYSSVSGTVKKIDAILTAGGTFCPAIVIESDGQMTPEPSIQPPVVNDYASFVEAVRESGIVGLGGAGFPTAVKLDVKDTSRIEELILNGAECEPFITTDTRCMIDNAADIKEAVGLFEKYLDVKKVLIGIEGNKPKAIEMMNSVFLDDPAVSVVKLPETYPQGAEKIIIHSTTGKVVPAGKLPIDVGCVVCNVTTMASIARFIRTGMPLVSKCLTVDGSAVEKPANIIVPIGTPITEILDYMKVDMTKVGKVLYGGPMMGIAIPDLTSAPVMKNTNAITVYDLKDGTQPTATQCIHCGKCANSCPMKLTTFAINRAYEKRDAEELRRLRVDLCCECGCCSYVCPAKRPLVEENKLAKVLVRELIAKEKAKEAEKK